MGFDTWTADRPYRSSMPAPGELMADYRARIAHEQSLVSERKQAELAEQVSVRNTPGERIRIWERRHGLTLPRDSNHRLLAVVASATDLAVEQVQEEQRRRLDAAKGGTPASVVAPSIAAPSVAAPSFTAQSLAAPSEAASSEPASSEVAPPMAAPSEGSSSVAAPVEQKASL